MFQRFGGKGSLTDLINDKVVCRTAPATLGLLNTEMLKMLKQTKMSIRSNMSNYIKEEEKNVQNI